MAVYVVVTPSDTTVYAPPVTSIWVGVAGNLAIMGVTDTVAVTLIGVPIGLLRLPYPVQKIMATNTTATTMIAAQGA